ncbi:hypothetical protein K9N68_11525 [Kovacikia minuta CCNUW1]|uniref:hypothetical protein n=1 Tax=Kovacikia minuta TaxID=2931930 RepID=UPI001CCFF7F4|nr:hypothetical protein [Kovacikia minuta]UBF28439.1 hypothetical protein K9N68_11525 [Kovacikia minuta CCNUW1]
MTYSAVAVVIAGLGIAVIVYALLKGPLALQSFILYAALIFGAALISATAAWNILWMPGAAGRYWFIPMLAFVTSWIWLLCQQPRRWLQKVAIGGLAVMAIGIGLDWSHTALTDFSFPKYANQFEQATQGTRIIIPINPPGWAMELIK